MTWVERTTVTYTMDKLPTDDAGRVALIDPSTVRLLIPGYRYPVDVGSWCYSRRKRMSTDTSSEVCASYLVDAGSFRPERSEFLRRYFDYILSHIQFGKASGSLKTSVGQFQAFVEWCNKHAVDALGESERYAEAVYRFTEEKIDLMRRSRLNINTAATMQQVILKVGRNIFNDPYGDLFRHVRKIRRSLSAVNKTTVPDEKKVRDLVSVYTNVFEQLSSFVLKFEQFPKKIIIGEEYFWFFPASIPFAGPTTISKKPAFKTKFLSYDYLNGRVRSIDEISRLSKHNIHSAHKFSHYTAANGVNLANLDKYHRRRRDAAMLAFQAYIMLFSANTGMNLGQIVQLPFSNEHDIIKDRLGFKGVKYRAGDKEVVFYIASRFYKQYKKFLELRKYILESVNKVSYRFLFFSVVGENVVQLGMNISTSFHIRLKNCFDIDEKVTTRMWRSNKGDWLIRNTDVETTATILQNSPVTVFKHYAEGSSKRNEEEMTKFFDGYKSLIIDYKEKTEETPVGHCLGKTPVAAIKPPVTPDCRSFEGCLFCENYKVHADLEDLKKLLSFKYLLQECISLVYSNDHFSKKILPIIKRIDYICDLIKSKIDCDAEAIKEVEIGVFEKENLSWYWQIKLDSLIDVGVLT